MFSCATVYDLWQGRAYEGDWVVCLQSSKFGNIYHLSQFWVAFIGLRNLSLQAQLKALPFADGSSLKLHLVDYQWFLKCSIVISCNDILTVSMWCATELFGKNKPAVLVQLLSPPPPPPTCFIKCIKNNFRIIQEGWLRFPSHAVATISAAFHFLMVIGWCSVQRLNRFLLLLRYS